MLRSTIHSLSLLQSKPTRMPNVCEGQRQRGHARAKARELQLAWPIQALRQAEGTIFSEEVIRGAKAK